MGGMSRIVTPELRQELDAKETTLRAQLGVLTAPVEANDAIGFGKRIGDGTTQAIQQAADASSAQELHRLLTQVLRAQAKIIEGSYGLCDVCAEDIPDERLEFRPWSTTCVRHAD